MITPDNSRLADRIADQWERNTGGYLTVATWTGDTQAWILRCKCDGTIINMIGPFTTMARAKREAAYLAAVRAA